MFGNQYNTNNGSNMNRNEINVNTKLRNFMNDDFIMRLGLWNDKLSIRLYRAIGTNANGYKEYDKNTAVITALNVDNIAALKNIIDEKIIPEMGSTMESLSCGVDVSNGSTYIGIETVPNAEDGIPDIYLVIVTGINESGASSENNINKFKFGKRRGKKNYNPITGIFEVEMVNGDFINFVKILDDCSALYNIPDHVKKFNSAFGGNGNYNPNATGFGGSSQNTNATNNNFMSIPDNGMMELPFN